MKKNKKDGGTQPAVNTDLQELLNDLKKELGKEEAEPFKVNRIGFKEAPPEDPELCTAEHVEVFGIGYRVENSESLAKTLLDSSSPFRFAHSNLDNLEDLVEVHLKTGKKGFCKKIIIDKNKIGFYNVNGNGEVTPTEIQYHKIVKGPQGTINKYWTRNDEKLRNLVSPSKNNEYGIFISEKDALTFANEMVFKKINILMERVSFNNIKKYGIMTAEAPSPVVRGIRNQVLGLFEYRNVEEKLRQFTPAELESDFDFSSPVSQKVLAILNGQYDNWDGVYDDGGWDGTKEVGSFKRFMDDSLLMDEEDIILSNELNVEVPSSSVASKDIPASVQINNHYKSDEENKLLAKMEELKAKLDALKKDKS